MRIVKTELQELLWNSYGTPILLSLSLSKRYIYIRGVPGVPYSIYTHGIVRLIGEMKFHKLICVETPRKRNSWNSYLNSYIKLLYISMLDWFCGVPRWFLWSYRSSGVLFFKMETPRKEVLNA
jgi:hypothetical protein